MSGRAPCCFLIVVTSQRFAGTGDLQVADDQFHLAFEVDGGDGAGGQQVASLVDGVAADGAFAVDD